MPYLRVWIHLIWATKRRERVITNELRDKIIKHIQDNAKAKGIFISSLNIVEDHLHLLVSLGASQDIAKIVRLLKGESSHWINQNKLTPRQFEWQDDYIAVSVSESQVTRVRNYIQNQVEHHRRKSYREEYEEYMEKLGFSVVASHDDSQGV